MKPRITLSAALLLGSAATTVDAGLVLDMGAHQPVQMSFGGESSGVTLIGDVNRAVGSVFIHGLHAGFEAAPGERREPAFDPLGRIDFGTHPSGGIVGMAHNLDAAGGADDSVTLELLNDVAGVVQAMGDWADTGVDGAGRSVYASRPAADPLTPAWMPLTSGGVPSAGMNQITEEPLSVIPLPRTALMGLAGLGGLGALLALRDRRFRLL